MSEFAKLTCPHGLKHALPFPGIESRNASAHILAMFDLRKGVTKTCLLVDTHSRAFIISQNGLEGFVSLKHNNINSWLYEARTFLRLAFLTLDEFNLMDQQLSALQTNEEKEALLKTQYLWVYYTLLEETGREEEVPKFDLEHVSY